MSLLTNKRISEVSSSFIERVGEKRHRYISIKKIHKFARAIEAEVVQELEYRKKQFELDSWLDE